MSRFKVDNKTAQIFSNCLINESGLIMQSLTDPDTENFLINLNTAMKKIVSFNGNNMIN
jgi:hypothetical protein